MKRIMELNKYKDTVIYRAACSCGDEKCDLTIMLEKDSNGDDITLLFYKNLHWSSYWQSDNIFFNFYLRIKAALKILFTGYIEVEEAFLFDSEDQINSFTKAINDSIIYLGNTNE